LQLLTDHDPLQDDHLETATLFKTTSSAIQNNLIKDINEVTLDKILRQIQEASYVGCFHKLATVLIYIHDGKILRRSIGFTNVSADRSSDGLFSHVQNVV
jgi:hypothetical protein